MRKTNMASDRKKALLVDDDEICRCVTAEILENLGLQVDIASDGLRAMCLAKTQDYDLLLLDLYMPTMNGAELADLLLENGFASEDKIFLLTGEEPGAVEKLRDGLSLRTLRKPLERSAIQAFLAGEPVQTQSADDDEPAARIAGFDIPRAVANFMGYEAAFFNILREFPDYGKKFIAEYASYLRTKNIRECRRLAHSIRGSSLMIGATELNALAQELETACVTASDVEQIKAAFDKVEEKILEASENVRKHFHLVDGDLDD